MMTLKHIFTVSFNVVTSFNGESFICVQSKPWRTKPLAGPLCKRRSRNHVQVCIDVLIVRIPAMANIHPGDGVQVARSCEEI